MNSNEICPEMHATTNLAKLSNKAQDKRPPFASGEYGKFDECK